MIPASQWTSAWSDHKSTTDQQAAGAEADLAKWLAGAPHVSFDAFRKLLEPILPKFKTLLEIGCGTGHYKPVLERIDPTKDYTGCDISLHMTNYANKKWGKHFLRCDSAELPFDPGRFDVTCISGLIQHLADYRPSIKEAVRVAKRWVMLHRVEGTTGENREFVRRAYDSDVPTRKVNEQELLAFCGLAGLTLRHRTEWSGTLTEFNCSMLFEKT